MLAHEQPWNITTLGRNNKERDWLFSTFCFPLTFPTDVSIYVRTPTVLCLRLRRVIYCCVLYICGQRSGKVLWRIEMLSTNLYFGYSVRTIHRKWCAHNDRHLSYWSLFHQKLEKIRLQIKMRSTHKTSLNSKEIRISKQANKWRRKGRNTKNKWRN